MHKNDVLDVDTRKLDLVGLAREGVPNMTQAWCATLAECASLCLHHNGYRDSANLKIQGDFETTIPTAMLPVDDVILRTHNDLDVAAELGAYGVAFLLINALTPLTIVERSKKGTGFDYWLGDKEDLLLQHKARLEVSGLCNGSNKEFNRRIKKKQNQARVSDNLCLPAWVVITDFGSPRAHIEEHKDENNG